MSYVGEHLLYCVVMYDDSHFGLFVSASLLSNVSNQFIWQNQVLSSERRQLEASS
jgi:hypothetical protein